MRWRRIFSKGQPSSARLSAMAWERGRMSVAREKTRWRGRRWEGLARSMPASAPWKETITGRRARRR